MADLDYNHSCEDSSLDSTEQNVGPDSKMEFSEDEVFLIIRMYNLVGERWSLIAGRIPGRSAEEIEKYWTSKFSTSHEEGRELLDQESWEGQIIEAKFYKLIPY